MVKCLVCGKLPYENPEITTYRITLLAVSITCVFCCLVLNVFMFKHRKLKVFKVASPIFLSITLLGCATMYLEMAAIFPALDTYACIATKWSRHLGFCVTYTALLMKTWRVSLTYRVKSAHKIKLTDKQLLQWMIPILLVMLIYLSTWTLSDTPQAEVIVDNDDLKFKQCVYNWWDHSLAIGEVLFLAWGVRVCYNVRNAESLYNEARLISYAIYNIAIVNIMMIAFHLIIFPKAGPDIKYFLGFIRTQLSTTTTIVLVFGPKIIRVLKGQGDQWDNRARSRGVTASFSLNGIGLVPEEAPDLYQENEELKEEIQKLAAQIEFMKIVHMETNNRHIKPKPGGYFSALNAPMMINSPLSKQISKPYKKFKKMVLVLNGVLQTKCPADTQSLYHTHPIYRETAGQLLQIPNKVIGPVGLLYIRQREFAATVPQDKNVSILGSDDATTCIIVVVRHTGSGAVALAHLDGTGTDEAVSTMIQRVQELALGYPEGRIELQLVGGYSDPNNYSENLFFNLMNSFHKQPVEIDLTLACVGQLNTTVRGGIAWPLVYGIGVNVKTGDIFPASFPDKGPDPSLRSARNLTGPPEVMDIYECNMGLLKVGPFNYKPLRGANLWLEQNDEFILRLLSTSPEVEPPHFADEMRATLKYIREHPFPSVTVFGDNRPHYFRRDEQTGLWVPAVF